METTKQKPASTQKQKPEWVKVVAPYQKSDIRKSAWQLINTLVPYFALWVLMYLSLSYSYWITLLLAVPAALFVVRIFVLQHDCGHGSFFKTKKVNDRVGMMLSIFTFVPYHYWRRTHAIHHSATGDLEHRGIGDFYTMTVNEYKSKTKWERIKYRLYRNPITMFVIAPTLVFIIGYRFDFLKRKHWEKEKRGLVYTNLALLALVVVMSYLIGFTNYVLIQLPITFIATGLGSWFFYVQHNFEDAYWDEAPTWDYTSAALQGSSYYKLPPVLKWFTGSIGFHHIHHLSPKIPNYKLEKCHNDNELFQNPQTLTISTSFQTMGLSLWDEDRGKLISFEQFKALYPQPEPEPEPIRA